MRRIVLTALMSVAALGVWGVVLYRWNFPPLPPAPTVAELEALSAVREALRERFQEVFQAKGDQGFAEAPKAGLLIGIPTSFTRRIVEQLVTGMLGDVTLTLRNVQAHHEGEVKVKGVAPWIEEQLSLNVTRYTQYPYTERPQDKSFSTLCVDDESAPVTPEKYCHTYKIAPSPVGWER